MYITHIPKIHVFDKFLGYQCLDVVEYPDIVIFLQHADLLAIVLYLAVPTFT